MDSEKKEKLELIKMESFLDYNKSLNVQDNTFKNLMFIYSIAIREIQTKIEILKDEFEVLYNYKLINNINTRIKKSDSIIKKMKKESFELTYKQMIENINDIAGIRIICPLKKDIFTIKDFIEKIHGIEVLKEKDYVRNPKNSGYSAYHIIVHVPINLFDKIVFVKVEIQVMTAVMDFWANLEHNAKYKSHKDISKQDSKQWVNCAKMINKLDNKMMMLNN